MKLKIKAKKLELNKNTVSNLNNETLVLAKGGADSDPYTWDCGVPTWYPLCYTYNDTFCNNSSPECVSYDLEACQ